MSRPLLLLTALGLTLPPSVARASDLDRELLLEVRGGRTERLAELVAAGADPDAIESWTPRRGRGSRLAEALTLTFAAPLLVLGGGRLRRRRDRGPALHETPLTAALVRHEGATRQRLVDELLRLGADPAHGPEEGVTPLRLALTSEPLDAGPVASLLEAGADPSAEALLPFTVGQGTQGLVVAQFLLDAGASAEEGHPLCLAAAADDLPLTRLLLERGAQLRDERDCPGGPLAMAAGGAGLALGRVLHEAGADPEGEQLRRRRPLDVAAQAGRLDWVRWLLERGARADVPSDSSWPLFGALAHRDAEMLQLLLDAGADPAAVQQGVSPLERAASDDWLEGGRILLAAGSYRRPGALARSAGSADPAAWAALLGASLPAELIERVGLAHAEQLAFEHQPAQVERALASLSQERLLAWQARMPEGWSGLLELPEARLRALSSLPDAVLFYVMEVLGPTRGVAALQELPRPRLEDLHRDRLLREDRPFQLLGAGLLDPPQEMARTLRRAGIRVRRRRRRYLLQLWAGDPNRSLRILTNPTEDEQPWQLRLPAETAHELAAEGLDDPLVELLRHDRQQAWLLMGRAPDHQRVHDNGLTDSWRLDDESWLHLTSNAGIPTWLQVRPSGPLTGSSGLGRSGLR